MPILLINKHTGQQIVVKGESDDRDFYARAHSGLVPVEWLDGHLGHVVKDSVWATKVIPLEEHNKSIEDGKKKAEEQEAEKKQQVEEQAKRKAEGLAKYEELQAEKVALEARKFKNRVKRLFRRG